MTTPSDRAAFFVCGKGAKIQIYIVCVRMRIRTRAYAREKKRLTHLKRVCQEKNSKKSRIKNIRYFGEICLTMIF